MNSLYLLIPIVLIGVVIAMRFLFWAIRSGQYDDLEKESQRILFDEPDIPENKRKDNEVEKNSLNKDG
ncbi:MAG: cbb3-type cytochrome oxidase assembly protein CcoS [Cellvibrionaceae bacterium]